MSMDRKGSWKDAAETVRDAITMRFTMVRKDKSSGRLQIARGLRVGSGAGGAVESESVCRRDEL
jgi:hypothetical protein